MPFYRYHCRLCDSETKKLLKYFEVKDHVEECPICLIPMEQTMGNPSSRHMVTADEYRGKKYDEDINKKLRDRAQNHFQKHELPRIIEKHGTEFCLKQGLIDIEGNPKRGGK